MLTKDDTNDAQKTNESDNGPHCDSCGASVTREYHRVLSDNEGILRSCLYCTEKGASRGEWL